MAVPDEAFVFDVGDHVLYCAPNGTLMRAVIMRRLRGRDLPEYQIRSLYAQHAHMSVLSEPWLESPCKVSLRWQPTSALT